MIIHLEVESFSSEVRVSKSRYKDNSPQLGNNTTKNNDR